MIFNRNPFKCEMFFFQETHFHKLSARSLAILAHRQMCQQCMSSLSISPMLCCNLCTLTHYRTWDVNTSPMHDQISPKCWQQRYWMSFVGTGGGGGGGEGGGGCYYNRWRHIMIENHCIVLNACIESFQHVLIVYLQYMTVWLWSYMQCFDLIHLPLDKMATILADNNFKFIFFNGNDNIKISLKFVPRSPMGNKPALVQVMTWPRIGDKPLPEPMLSLLTDANMRHKGRWVNSLYNLSQV